MSVDESSSARSRALTAMGEELSALLHHRSADVLLTLLDNPELDEAQICLLLGRRDLPVEVIEEVGRRKQFLKNYRVKKALVYHHRTPRLLALRLLRDLYLMDWVQLTFIAGVSAELKLKAEEQIVGRLPQLPLGQKITLARRGPARVAGSLLAEGHPRIISIALDNANLTEAQILKVLAKEKLPPQVVLEITQHRKWSHLYNVRLALVRNSFAPLSAILAYLPELTVSDLKELVSPGIVPENLRNYLQAEVQRRIRAGKKIDKR